MLKGLAGISAKEIEHEFINKPSDIKRILDAGKGATTARDNGAINVWKDDEGFIRCEAQRYQVSIDTQKFTNFIDAKSWVKEWLEKIK